MNCLKFISNACLIYASALITAGCVLPFSAVGADQPSFAATRLFQAGDTPDGLTVGDFNRDGVPDLAVANLSSPGVVAVLLGNGDGSFQSAITNTAGDFLEAVTSADVNHDGNPDLIASGLLGVSLLLGNGDGTFQTATALSGPSNPALAFGDFNGDNSPDMVYYNSGIGVTVALGNGDGTFQSGTGYTISFTASPDFLTVKDMNHDGINDIVAACGVYSGAVSILLGKGDGTFKNVVNTPVGTYDYALAAGDFNGDGTNDVAVTDYDAGTVTVLLGKGDGSLLINGTYNVGAQAQSVATGDFNGDGANDLVVAAGTNAAVLLGNGDGTFQAPVKYDNLRISAVVGDFNGDGKADLASALLGNTTSIGVALGNGDGTFQGTPNYLVELGPESIAIGDLNGDGQAELVVANANSNNVSVLVNNGDGTFQTRSNYLTGANPQSVAVADFSGLGTNDVVVANLNDSAVSLLRGNGDGTLQPATSAGSVTIGSSYVLAGDFNNDHKTDLAALGYFLNTSGFFTGILVFPGNGDGTFQPTAVTTPGPFLLDQLASADFNHDGKLDVVYDNNGSNTVSVMLGNGDGSFQPPMSYDAGSNVRSVAVGDFNGDGANDLAVASFGDGSSPDGMVSVLLGKGDGTFGPATNCLTGDHFQSVAAGDFNADGKVDLAVADGVGDSQIDVLPGNGDGTFQPPVVFAVGNNPSFIAAGDLNGDGLPDLAVANAAANSVSVLLNTFTAVGPTLKVLPINPADKTLTFSWPVSAAGFTLEAVTNLDSANWQAPSATSVTNNGNVEVTVPVGTGSRFFRLHKK